MTNLIITSFPDAYSNQDLKQKLSPCEFWNPEVDPDPQESFDLVYNRYIWLTYNLSHLERIYKLFPQALNLPRNPLVFYDKWEQSLWFEANDVQSLPTALPAKNLGAEFPLIAKPRLGMKGYKVRILKDEESYKEFLKQKDYEFIIQPWFPVEDEIRILIGNAEFLGAWSKVSWEKVEYPLEYDKLKQLVDNEGAYFYSLDFFKIEGQFFLNEVNLNPGWKRVPERIIESFLKGIKKPVARTGSLKWKN